MHKTLLAALPWLLLVGSSRAEEPRRVVLGALHAELDRAMGGLRLPDYEKPYFIAMGVRDYDGYELVGKFGAVFSDDHRRVRHAYVEVRVGDYRFDNTSTSSEPDLSIDGGESWDAPTDAPVDDSPGALRGTLWLLADQKYKQALADYAKKRGKRATTLVEDDGLPSFSREPPAVAAEPPQPISFDRGKVADRARRVTERFRRYPELFDAQVRFAADRVTRYLVNSEGSELVTERAIYTCVLSATARAADGMLLEHEKAFYSLDAAGIPDDNALLAAVDQLASELRALRQAPVIDPYTGPAILMQQAAGVFFHEAVGHRLEGERQNDEKEGRTFKGQIGRRILPDFLSVIDDPTRRTVGQSTLNGYYHYDDEGVAAHPVALIEHGVLRDYLMSRTPIQGSTRSNGHGRAEATADPMGRMANLVVQSSKRVSESQLKKMLLDEVRRQGKPFGLLIRDITGGATDTSQAGFQAFKGQPRLVYKVDAKTGAETLVRGVEMVGTPLASVNKIVATSDTLGVFNGFCGAESGFVPVSTVAPAVLMTEIELERSQRALERPLILPPPWAEPPAK